MIFLFEEKGTALSPIIDNTRRHLASCNHPAVGP
jgi:hypothetical protein